LAGKRSSELPVAERGQVRLRWRDHNPPLYSSQWLLLGKTTVTRSTKETLVRSLVTGGAGFIGSHLVEALAKRGDQVVVLDDLSTGRRGNLVALARGIDLVEVDSSIRPGPTFGGAGQLRHRTVENRRKGGRQCHQSVSFI